MRNQINKSIRPMSFQIFQFGKYKGKSFDEVAELDPVYCCYIYDNVNELETGFVEWFEAKGIEIRKEALRRKENEWN